MTARDRYLLDRYGIDEAFFKRILNAQGGQCGICPRKWKEGEPNFHLDHSHKSGAIRGILCPRCNERLLPASLDNPDLLRRAADYLEREPWGFVPEDRRKTKKSPTTRYKNAPAWMRPKGAERRM